MRGPALVMLLAACRLRFDPLGGSDGGATADGNAGDGGDLGDPGPEMFVFGAPVQEASLSTGRDDQSPTLTADMLEIYFMSNRTTPSQYDIFVATRATTSDPWGTPVEVAEIADSAKNMTPEVSPDGLTLWFATERGATAGGSDIWVTTRATRTSPWAAPVPEPNLSTAGYDLDPALSDDGLTMLLTSDGAGGLYADMFIATRATTSSPWSTPVPVDELNTAAHDSAGSLRGNVLFFGRETSQFDIYSARRDAPGAPFQAAMPVGNINTASLEFDAWVSLDTRTLFFASDRTGDYEIFSATR